MAGEAEPIAGVILAGGASRRMGGVEKSLMELAGKPLLGHAVDRLRPQTCCLAINANGDPSRFRRFSLPVLQDSIPGRAGPLAGILAGLDWAAEAGLGRIVTAAGDTPFFPSDIASRLAAESERSGAPIALAATKRAGDPPARHPTFGLWPTRLRHDLRAALESGLRKIVDWTDRHGAVAAEFESDERDPFFNINTPEDLATARTIAGDDRG